MEFKGLNGIEYSYEKRVEGAYLRNKILFNIGCAAATIVLCALCIAVKLLVYFTPVMFLICVILHGYLKVYFQIGYEYKIDGGVFYMNRKYGEKIHKPYYSVDLRNVEKIVPAEKTEKCDVTYDSCISVSSPSPELYAVVYKNEAGKTVKAYFEATKETLKAMKYYHPDTEISPNVRH